MKRQTTDTLDAVGVGIGPFNLSVAALLQEVPELRSRFFERELEFQWHPGLMFPEATIQVSFLKDLVTLASPTSPFSFLSFLFAQNRLYRFIIANFPKVTRMEFNQYLRWVCDSLPNLEFGRAVEAVYCDGESFVVETGTEAVRARNLVLGSGLAPVIPECARPYLGPTVLHASRFLKEGLETAGRRVVVVGGGQTGAEVFHYLLSDKKAMPRELHWVSRRQNFLPLDESPFTNELFTPAYSDYFFNLSREEKSVVLSQQKLASDGIASELLAAIYRRLYELEFLNGHGGQQRICHLWPSQELYSIRRRASDGWLLTLRNNLNGQMDGIEADLVVLCTGSEYRLPKYLEPLKGRLALEPCGGLKMREDFSIEWDGPPTQHIYAQNAARHARGVADPNLSLMAWRSAVIVNSLAGRCVYNVKECSSVFNWMAMEVAEQTEGAY